MSELRETLARQGEMWGAGDYERIAKRFAPIHDALVARLEPRREERWLDVATGTGEVALRAARAGAEVTGLDISAALLAQARAKARSAGLAITLDVGDAQRLPYPDASFDVVTSCFGVIFPPDQEAVASELARVCRAGGRLGLTTWRPKPALKAIYERFQDEPPADDRDAWGDERRLQELLGDAFELVLEEHVWRLEGDSPEAVWELMENAAPPLKAFADRLEAERRREFRRAFIEHWQGFRSGEGTVSEPRAYLLVLGKRR